LGEHDLVARAYPPPDPHGTTTTGNPAGGILNPVADLDTHLQMIQTTIGRLAGQSTTIKGWTVTLTSALLGLGATSNTALLPGLAIYVIAVFALLDAYYLTLERSYRTLYNTTRTHTTTDWTMTTPTPTPSNIGKALTSWSITPLYASSLALAIATTIYTAHK
jgi:hypothetical protein